MGPDDDELSALIKRHATRHRASDDLRAGIRTQVALADAGRGEPQKPARWRGFRAFQWADFGWRSASAGFAVGLLAAVLVLPVLRGVELGSALPDELVADHVRALQIGPLTEVVSTDRHTVKPWFQGRLDYAPPVFDLADDGFPLAGGRVEHVRGSAVAALAYTHNRHVVDVFVWPADAVVAPTREQRKGFNVVRWSDGTMQVWVVSDADRSEIERFAQAWQQRALAAR